MATERRQEGRYIAPDGTPQYAIWAEQWLVGGAMLARAQDVPQNLVEADEFHDFTLGRIWEAVANLAASAQEPSATNVAALLNEWGELDNVGAEPRLALLCSDEFALLYAGKASLAAHAAIVHEWGDKRRRIAELAEEARRVYDGRVLPAAHRFRGGVTFDYTESTHAEQP